MTDNSEYGDFAKWCKVQGLPMPISNPEEEDAAETLQLTPDLAAWRAKWAQQFRAPDVEPEPDDAPITPAEPETLEPED